MAAPETGKDPVEIASQWLALVVRGAGEMDANGNALDGLVGSGAFVAASAPASQIDALTRTDTPISASARGWVDDRSVIEEPPRLRRCPTPKKSRGVQCLNLS
jgi:hypothetical protein